VFSQTENYRGIEWPFNETLPIFFNDLDPDPRALSAEICMWLGLQRERGPFTDGVSIFHDNSGFRVIGPKKFYNYEPDIDAETEVQFRPVDSKNFNLEKINVVTSLDSSLFESSFAGNDVVIWEKGEGAKRTRDNFPSELIKSAETGNLVLCEVYEPRISHDIEPNAFTEMWDRCMPEPIIPYDLKKRQEIINSIPELKPFVEKWRSLKKLGVPELTNLFRKY